MKIYDISQELLSSAVYEGDPKPTSERIKSTENGDLYNLSTISMCAHNGTHIDAPLHFLDNGDSIDTIPLSHFVGECYVAQCDNDIGQTEAEDIYARATMAGANERILIKSKNYITNEGAYTFAKYKLKLLGCETQSVGPYDSPMSAHIALLSEQTVLLEGVVLDNIPEGKYLLSSAPLNIAGIEGSPCRAILIEF